jgi:hypothetical protein
VLKKAIEFLSRQ